MARQTLPTISQRPDGRFWARIEVARVGGKRKWKHIYGKTKKEVKDQLILLLAQQQQGVNIAPERTTVAQFLEGWLVDVVAPTKRPRTVQSYRYLVETHIVPYVGDVQLAKLAPEHVQRMLRHLEARGLAPATVQRIHGTLRNALGVAVRWERVQRNVAMIVDAPPVEQYQATVLIPEQAQQLLHAVRGHRLEALYLVELSLGLRKGELLGLRWHDVDLKAGTLHITHQLQVIDNKPVLVAPKTKRSRRTIPLSASLVAALRQHHARQLREGIALGTAWHDHDLVFASEVGTAILPSNFTRSFHRLLKRAGMERMRVHDLRHSCATFLALQGVEPRTAMEILGHSTITITLQLYTHALEQAKRMAVTKMDTLLDAKAVG
jgi:integrase